MDKSITLAEYTAYWLAHIAPGKLAKSTLARDKQDIDRFLPALGSYKLTDLKPEHFRNLYAQLRKQKHSVTGKPLSESTVEGVHACLCGILSDAMEGGFLLGLAAVALRVVTHGHHQQVAVSALSDACHFCLPLSCCGLPSGGNHTLLHVRPEV